jgi:hypothetical protein
MAQILPHLQTAVQGRKEMNIGETTVQRLRRVYGPKQVCASHLQRPVLHSRRAAVGRLVFRDLRNQTACSGKEQGEKKDVTAVSAHGKVAKFMEFVVLRQKQPKSARMIAN